MITLRRRFGIKMTSHFKTREGVGGGGSLAPSFASVGPVRSFDRVDRVARLDNLGLGRVGRVGRGWWATRAQASRSSRKGGGGYPPSLGPCAGYPPPIRSRAGRASRRGVGDYPLGVDGQVGLGRSLLATYPVRAGRASRRGVGAYPDGAMVDSAYPRPTPPPAYTNLRR
jgi:hypothetical protein